MIRGTRIIRGDDARQYSSTCQKFRDCLIELGYEEIIVPSLAQQQVFTDKAGPEILGQMYTFPDKKDRPICLIPEVTAVVQQLWREKWERSTPKPYRVFYIQRCYRYERPQAGRYREFTQAGVEILGGNPPRDRDDAIRSLRQCLDQFSVNYTFVDSVKRGISYYVEDGFEVEVPALGAQKQIAGGGRYAEGIGWAVGIDRLILAAKDKKMNMPEILKQILERLSELEKRIEELERDK